MGRDGEGAECSATLECLSVWWRPGSLRRECRWGLSDQCFPSNREDENPRSQGGRVANRWWDSWLIMVVKESKEFTSQFGPE